MRGGIYPSNRTPAPLFSLSDPGTLCANFVALLQIGCCPVSGRRFAAAVCWNCGSTLYLYWIPGVKQDNSRTTYLKAKRRAPHTTDKKPGGNQQPATKGTFPFLSGANNAGSVFWFGVKQIRGLRRIERS